MNEPTFRIPARISRFIEQNAGNATDPGSVELLSALRAAPALHDGSRRLAGLTERQVEALAGWAESLAENAKDQADRRTSREVLWSVRGWQREAHELAAAVALLSDAVEQVSTAKSAFSVAKAQNGPRSVEAQEAFKAVKVATATRDRSIVELAPPRLSAGEIAAIVGCTRRHVSMVIAHARTRGGVTPSKGD